jgi:hypothetical protein
VNYLVLHVRPYDFEGNDKKRHQGATVTYLDLSATAPGPEMGSSPLKLSVDAELAKRFTVAPALYQLSFGQRRGKDGKPSLYINGAKLEAAVNLTDGTVGGN